MSKRFHHTSTYYRRVKREIVNQKQHYIKNKELECPSKLNSVSQTPINLKKPDENFRGKLRESIENRPNSISLQNSRNFFFNLDHNEESCTFVDNNIDIDGSFNGMFEQDTAPNIDGDNLNFEERDVGIALKLRCWALTHNITHKALNYLLDILIRCGFTWLPKDSRTLLKTPRKIEIESMGSGKFWYYGLESCLRNVYNNLQDSLSISLTFNIDGLPIHNSSKYQFWPILCIIDGKENTRPMTIAVYCGEGKPPSLNDYFRKFVEELKWILSDGIQINDSKISVSIRCFICDSPARSFVKGTVNFNSAHGCQKCEVIGEFDFHNGRHMSFPRINGTLRTNESFRNQTDEDHHKELSPLIELPINLVDDFIVADSLHLLELGVMKRCLLGWIHGSFNFRAKFSVKDIEAINNLLQEFNTRIPSELHRAVRTLDSVKHWKGLEFRTFLLYLGMVVLKDVLSSEFYEHFLKLCCAVILCSCKHYLKYLDLADVLFKEYIEDFISIYGIDSIQSNVHNLCHVVADVKNFGDLTTLTAYPFENYLSFIKRILRQGNLPLEQLSRRIIELELLSPIKTYNLQYPYIKNRKKKNLLYTYLYISAGITLSNEVEKDKWFLTRNNEIVELINVSEIETIIVIVGKSIKRKYNFFSTPFSSSNINIYATFGEQNVEKKYGLKEVKCKLLSLKYRNETIFMPLLHTLDELNK